jgi:hypothetical protein
MTNPQAWKGDYVDLKFIKSRKIAQIWIEIPIEDATQFVADFGAPNPAFGIPIALARLNKGIEAVSDDAAVEGKAAQKAREQELKGGPLAKRAGILCNEKAFWKFISLYREEPIPEVNSSKLAACYVRGWCGVESRAELDHNQEAARKFHDLEASYRAWLQV